MEGGQRSELATLTTLLDDLQHDLLTDAADPAKPLSDQAISDALKEKGVTIARRTVVKYREQLGILASSKRKVVF